MHTHTIRYPLCCPAKITDVSAAGRKVRKLFTEFITILLRLDKVETSRIYGKLIITFLSKQCEWGKKTNADSDYCESKECS